LTENPTKKLPRGKSLSSVEKAVAKLGLRSNEAESPTEPPPRPAAAPVDAAGADSAGVVESAAHVAEAAAVRRSATPHPGLIADPSSARRPHPFGTGSGIGGSGRTSRKVEIDLDRLRVHGMLAPDAEHSLLAEEFRLIKRPILLKAMEKGPNSRRNSNLIMVTSARQGEGKTFCSVSLAMSIASEPDLTVLLVDADVAKSNLPDVFGFDADLGLVDVISDDSVGLSDVLLRTQLDNLSILPAGRPHHLATEYLASDRMARLVDDIAERYSDRIIIFDSPPVLASSVASVLALHVGQIIFVVEAGGTPEAALDNALPLVSSCKNVSLLLNKSRAIAGTDKFGAYYYR
jgi:protein-tyrosine kinase